MKIRQSIIWIISLSIINVYAFRDISSIDLVKDIRLGWNLGNTLDINCENLLEYDNDPKVFETCLGNPVTTEDVFNTLINHGFNLFRIPIRWYGHFGEAPNYIIDHKWLSRVHEIVDYSYQNGVYVIINNSFDVWNNTYPRDINHAIEITTKLWEQIAEEFKEYDEHLIFENINSPNKKNFNEEGDKESWEFINITNQVFIDTIRKGKGNNPNRHLLIAPYAAMVQENSIKNFHIPTTDNKIMISLHNFTPYNFTHGKIPKFTDTKSVDKIMKLIKNEFLSKNIAVIITEFGATANNNENERIHWADYFITKASNLGIPCTLWDNGKINKGKESYGIIDRTTYSIQYQDYINSLLEGSYSSIDNNNNRKKLKKKKKKGKKVDKKITEKSENPSVNRRRELNSNIKIDPYLSVEGDELENSKIIFSATNIMKPLNNTTLIEKNKDKEMNEKNMEASRSSSLNKREEPNSDIKIEPYTADGEELETNKIIFSATNVMIALNNTKTEENDGNKGN
ncbi:glycoside hydrolase superfamily [Neocallimastix lanati (nom. inval.)]|nr:glycoside hydrolase superfamily [Neocallimastix sp. JGI-2020a]